MPILRNAPRLLSIGAAMLLLAALGLAFRSGCAGDLKSGAVGSPTEALHFESLATSCFAAAFVVAALAVAASRMRFTARSAAVTIAAALLGLFFFWLLAIQLQVWGTQLCLGAR